MIQNKCLLPGVSLYFRVNILNLHFSYICDTIFIYLHSGSVHKTLEEDFYNGKRRSIEGVPSLSCTRNG